MKINVKGSFLGIKEMILGGNLDTHKRIKNFGTYLGNYDKLFS